MFRIVRFFVVSALLFGVAGSLSFLHSAESEPSKPYIFLFSGPKGSGRSRLVVKVHTLFSVPLISTAELVMDHIHDDSELGKMAREQASKSCAFSNEYFFDALFERIGAGGCQKGFILDGMPRTLDQAHSLYSKLSNTFNILAFHIDVADAWLINRVEGRLVCPTCGKVYYSDEGEDESKMVCETCHTPLQRRQQDTPEVIADSLKKDHIEMDPIVKFYANKNILVTVRGDRTIDEMFNDIVKIIETKTGLKPSISCRVADRWLEQ